MNGFTAFVALVLLIVLLDTLRVRRALYRELSRYAEKFRYLADMTRKLHPTPQDKRESIDSNMEEKDWRDTEPGPTWGSHMRGEGR